MLTLTNTVAVMIGVFLALWLALAVWAVWSGLALRKQATFSTNQADRLASLLESAPALPLMVKNDGRIEAPERLADWLGLPKIPNFLSDLTSPNAGLSDEDATALVRDVAAVQKTGRNFTRALRAQGSSRTLLVRGSPAATRLAASGAVILWWFDATESQTEIGRLGEEVARLGLAFNRLSALIEASPVPMWYRGADMKLALVNSAYVRAVEGANADDVIMRGLELVDAGNMLNPLATAMKAFEKQQVESNIAPVTIAGDRRAMRLVDVPLGDAGVAGYAIDVEDVERAGAAFRRFAATQRDTLDRLSAGVAQFGPDRALIFCNQPFERQFALKTEWVAERPNFDRLLDRMREAGRVPETRDFPGWKAERREWFTAPDGAIEENWIISGGQHLRLVAQPLPDGGLLLIFENRTEQAQLASARDTLLRVRTATFDTLFEAIGVFEADGRLHLWNNKFRDMWGFEESFFAGHPHVDALAEAAAAKLSASGRAAVIREAVRSATIERTQKIGRLAMKDGRHFEFAAVPLPDGNALLALLDITDSRKVERVLRDRADALEESDKIKTAFVANMSYELRTPLTSISGFAEMLDQGFGGALEPAAKDYVAAILESTERLSGLVDRVLDLTQSDAGSLPMERKPIELAVLLLDAARDHKPTTVAKNLDFAIEIDPGVGAIRGDAKRLRQAVDHLLDNEIVVSDNGPGMDAAAQAAALDRFSRVTETRDGGSALGLGLPLAKQFVEAHGGTLTLMSEPGEGTAISVVLPR
jgi:signal transduction histidine kinase